jgi:hypothetical protein
MPFPWFGKGKGEEGARVKDPVCDMEVDPKTAAASYEYGGRPTTSVPRAASTLSRRTPRNTSPGTGCRCDRPNGAKEP